MSATLGPATAESAASGALAWYESGERAVPAALTVERLRPHLAALGITRLARQTGLDRLGIPCFSAIRPAGLTLSVSQGKGRDDASAAASALMEAAEYAIAEAPQNTIRVASALELRAAGDQVFVPRRLLPQTHPFAWDLKIGWVEGQTWPAGERIWLPRDALTIGGDPEDLPQISRSTNGLASGNSAPEALFHAICELIERDASSLWSLLPDSRKLATEFSYARVEDASLVRMCEQIEAAGLTLRLFDQTTDLGVPCAMAVILEPGERRFDEAAGFGCHPVGARAIARAVTEAAQTRITNIAGGRDDFLPSEYAEALDASTAFLLESGSTEGAAPAWLRAGTPLPDMLDALGSRLGAAAEIVWAQLGGESYGIAVVRTLSGVLEDRETNANWRPGRRAMAALVQ